MKSRRTRWVGNVAHIGEKRSAYKVLVAKFEGKKPLGSRKNRRIAIKWILDKENEGVDWSHLAQDRNQGKALANKLMSIQISLNTGNSLDGSAMLTLKKDSAPWKLLNRAHSRCLSTHDIKIF
jgi:hypothetical protein